MSTEDLARSVIFHDNVSLSPQQKGVEHFSPTQEKLISTMNFLSPKKKKPDQLRQLIDATCNGWTTAVVKLAENGINLDAKTETGVAALHVAAQSGNNSMVRALIKLGADVNCRENNCLSTPLHFAAMRSKVVTVQDLIQIRNAIADRGCDLGGLTMSEDVKYSVESYEAVIMTLVRKGADLNARDSHGKTPLHLAVQHRSDSVNTLVGLGADVDAKDDEGRLPWQYAVQYENFKGLQWLLAFGADINDFNMFRKSDLEEIKLVLMRSHMKYTMFDQLTRLRAAELFVSRVYPIFDSPGVYYNECVEEVRRMKSYEIDDGVSLYDFLHMSPRCKAAYVKDSEKTNEMLIRFERQFRNYYGIIRASFFDERKRKPLLEDAKLAWYRLTKIGLPDICVEHILSYLNGCYLRIMVDGAKACEDLE